MNEVTIKGEIVFVDEVREYGANGFRKHQVVVETGGGKWANPCGRMAIESHQVWCRDSRRTLATHVCEHLAGFCRCGHPQENRIGHFT